MWYSEEKGPEAKDAGDQSEGPKNAKKEHSEAAELDSHPHPVSPTECAAQHEADAKRRSKKPSDKFLYSFHTDDPLAQLIARALWAD
jgi:hypothetical protein